MAQSFPAIGAAYARILAPFAHSLPSEEPLAAQVNWLAGNHYVAVYCPVTSAPQRTHLKPPTNRRLSARLSPAEWILSSASEWLRSIISAKRRLSTAAISSASNSESNQFSVARELVSLPHSDTDTKGVSFPGVLRLMVGSARNRVSCVSGELVLTSQLGTAHSNARLLLATNLIVPSNTNLTGWLAC